MVVTPPSVSGHIRSGAVKALALASDQRHPAFAEIPTTAEAGLPGYKLDGWFALFAPAGTPQPIIDKLNARHAQDRADGLRQAARQPARHGAEGLEPRPRWTSSPGARSPTGAR